MENNLKRKRLYYGMATGVLLVIEVLIALFVHDDFVRPYVGDMLVVVVIYTFLRMFIPEGCPFLPLAIFVFAAGVEALQGLHIVELLSLQDSPFFRILIGSVCDWKDIACYAIGCVCLGVWEWHQPREKDKRKTNEKVETDFDFGDDIDADRLC